MQHIRQWLPIIGLAFSTFIFNTSEFIPIGLLSDIARDFSMSEAGVGHMITLYAWMVALSSLPLMLLASNINQRSLLLGLLGLFVLSHVLSFIAPSYGVLLFSRVGVACAHAVFWSIVTPLAMQIAPEGKQSSALGIVITGSSLAMILGLPIGRFIGLLAGWRMTFLLIGVFAVLVLLLLLVVLPKVPNQERFSLRQLPRLFANRALLGIYLLTAVMITAHFTAYSYIEPFLSQVAHFTSTGITLTLSVFGLVGVAASAVFSRYFDRSPFSFVRYALLGIPLFMLLLEPLSGSSTLLLCLCICWGLAISTYNLVFQMEVIRLVPHSTSIVMSVYSGIYNVGIGMGALLGGRVCEQGALSDIGYVGGVVAMLAASYGVVRLIKLLRFAGC